MADQVTDLVDDAEESKPDVSPQSEDVKQLQDLYDLMRSEGLENLEMEGPDAKIRLDRGGRQAPLDESPPRRSVPSRSPSEPASAYASIVSPLAGIFYRSSSPTGAPYTTEGAAVDPGQTLCVVEAMKVMNEIKAESRCRIVKIAAENSRPVTAGQILFLVEPA